MTGLSREKLWKYQTLAERVVAQAIHQETVQGYVRMSDIWKAEKVSRQRVDQAFAQAVNNKLITQQQLEDWKQSYKARTVRAEWCFSKTNSDWVKQQAEELDLSIHDVVNRVLHKHIHSKRHANLTRETRLGS